MSDTTAEKRNPLVQNEPIAIIGIGCRLPGDIATPNDLWATLAQGRSTHCKVPSSRYNADAFYNPDPDRPGSISSTGGYFLNEDVRQFENSFFGINNVEARTMDAQQRKLLEVVYESLENAGLTLQAVSGQNIGCYVGNFALDHIVMQLHDPEYVDRYTASGATPNILANRISHAFNFKGPSFVMDTACSSSLYSLHYACLALDAGECDAAVVASANLIQSPQHQMIATKAGILSGSATCKTFDASADGYGRAEGVGSLILKRLSDAERDGDVVRAVIRGTAVNSNGHTNGIMLPDAIGQLHVMQKAYARAGLSTDQTDYVEAHGTGTAVGDPIEVEGISKMFQHSSGRPTMIGSVKTNLGHSEAMSGISSVIKVALALEHQKIPPTIGIQTLNPKVACRTNIEVVQKLQDWPLSAQPRASVNSFGFGGANSHAILEAYTPQPLRNGVVHTNTTVRSLALLPVSARTQSSLLRRLDQIKSLAGDVACSVSTKRLAYTLAQKRTRFDDRGFLIVDATSQNPPSIKAEILGSVSGSTSRPLLFLFTGQGAQWTLMGLELFQEFEVVRTTMSRLDTSIRRVDCKSPFSLVEYYTSIETSSKIDVNCPEIAQVLSTALQISLVNLFRSFGISPQAVVGHSSGEIAAAYAAGHVAESEAIMISYLRGLSVSASRSRMSPGAMLAVGMDETLATKTISQLGLDGKIRVACVNSPTSVTISGDKPAIRCIEQELTKTGMFHRVLKTNGIAYHSHLMAGPVGISYRQLIDTHLPFTDFEIPHGQQPIMVSSVTGQPLKPQNVRSSRYWQQNLEHPVLFSQAARHLLSREAYDAVEIGPHAALQGPFQEISQSIDAKILSSRYTSSLTRHQDATVSILSCVGKLWTLGHEPRFRNVNSINPCDELMEKDLPNYPWDYSRGLLWKEPRAIQELRQRKFRRHELLGSLTPGGNGSLFVWRNVFSVDDVPWVKDHCFGPTVIFPAVAYITMAMEALCQLSNQRLNNCQGIAMRDVRLFKALPVNEPVELFTRVERLAISTVDSSQVWWQFGISSFEQGEHTTHMGGMIALKSRLCGRRISNVSVDGATLGPRSSQAWYRRLGEIGFNVGPTFKTVEKVLVDRSNDRKEAVAHLPLKQGATDPVTGEPQYPIHPTTIDAMFQTIAIAATAGRVAEARPWIPLAIEDVDFVPPAFVKTAQSQSWSIASRAQVTGFGTILGSAQLQDESGEVILRMKNVRSTTYQGLQQNDAPVERLPVLRVDWKPDISFLGPSDQDCLRDHASKLLQSSSSLKMVGDGFLGIATVLDLVVHKEPNLAILTIGDLASIEQASTSILHHTDTYKRFKTWDHATVENGTITDICSFEGNTWVATTSRPPSFSSYDLVVVHATLLESTKRNLMATLGQDTKLLCSSDVSGGPMLALDAPKTFAFDGLVKHHPVHFFANTCVGESATIPVHLVHDKNDSKTSPIVSRLSEQLRVAGLKCSLVAFDAIDDETFEQDAVIVSTVELETPIMSSLSPRQMSCMQAMTASASRIVWLSRGDLVNGSIPEATIMRGAARAIMLEQPSLKIATLDVDQVASSEMIAANTVEILRRITSSSTPDLEYTQINDVVFTSRWVPDCALNSRFQQALAGTATETQLKPSGDVTSNFEISIARAGQLDSIQFSKTDKAECLLDDQVEVEAACYSINAKDLYLLSARFDTPDASCSCEMSGLVSRVGKNVVDLKVGDRVVVMAPGKYQQFQVVPHWACAKLESDESFEETCTLPIVTATAIYAFKDKAQLEPGESVLIHSATGGLGLAAIQLAKILGAEIYATAGTAGKRQYLVDHCGLLPSHVFDSRSTSFLADILDATGGRGVDVVLNSLAGDLLHASFKACASFGRFIELGKRDIIGNGRLEMGQFEKHLTFIALDLMDIYHSPRPKHHQLWQRLLQESVELYRSKRISAVAPRKLFDIGDITQAFRYFAQPSRMGKVVVSLENPQSSIKLWPGRYDSRFHHQKAYLLVGCFGGIGRSVARWMLSRGARHFVFMSRSGARTPSATHLLDDIAAAGGTSQVLQSDVSKADDVLAAVRATSLPIGGVVQASMAVKATNWEFLQNKDWHAGIASKVQGTWNLHEALHNHSPDFFLLVSSVSGTIGSPTEPSYCAANSFMDHFARFRRALGLPASSLALGVINDVGYLHEHPEMEAVFSRRGFQGIREQEMLLMVDMAIASDQPGRRRAATSTDALAHSHILTGLELQVAKAQAIETGSSTFEVLFADPRSSVLAASYARDVGTSSSSPSSPASSSAASKLPREIADAQRSGVALPSATQDFLARKFRSIIMLGDDEPLGPDTPLASFGLDSMLAAEYRGFIFAAFQVDLPFMVLLAGGTSIASLAAVVLGKIGV